MKKLFMLASATLLIAGATFAGNGDHNKKSSKSCCTKSYPKGKSCCSKDSKTSKM